MDAGVRRDVDPLDGRPCEAKQALGEPPLRRGQREHRATVIGIRMKVEEVRRRRPTLDRLEHGAIAPLTHVRNGQQQRRLAHKAEG